MGKLTFSITMTGETRQALDQKVAEGRFRGRSDANEYYVKRGMELENKEREFLESRERELITMCARNDGGVTFLYEYLKVAERHPKLLEDMRETLQQYEGR